MRLGSLGMRLGSRNETGESVNGTGGLGMRLGSRNETK